MTYEATLKVKFDTKFVNHSTYGVYDDEILPEEHYTFEIPVDDINTIQLFRFFGTIARTMGHNELGIMKGACSLAFNDMRNQEDMKKIAEEFDLKLSEDYEKELRKLEDEICDLKAKLSRLENPENPQYTDEEMDAMLGDYKYYEWNGLVPGSPEAVAAGCTCPVMDNEEMPLNKKWVNADCPIHGRKTTA
jgi:hypothetical protein